MEKVIYALAGMLIGVILQQVVQKILLWIELRKFGDVETILEKMAEGDVASFTIEESKTHSSKGL